MCIVRGFGYARVVKEMLKRDGNSISVNNGYSILSDIVVHIAVYNCEDSDSLLHKA